MIMRIIMMILKIKRTRIIMPAKNDRTVQEQGMRKRIMYSATNDIIAAGCSFGEKSVCGSGPGHQSRSTLEWVRAVA